MDFVNYIRSITHRVYAVGFLQKYIVFIFMVPESTGTIYYWQNYRSYVSRAFVLGFGQIEPGGHMNRRE